MQTIKKESKIKLREYSFSFNSNLINKPNKEEKLDYTSFKNFSGYIDELMSIIRKGYAFAPFTYKGKRSKKNTIKSDLWVGDVDEGLSIDEALQDEFIKNHCLIYTSPSHTQEHHKYRLICFSPVPLNNDEYEQLGKIINDKIGGHLDAQAMEAGRLFFGCSYATFYNQNCQELPYQLIEQAREKSSEIEVKKKQQRRRNISAEIKVTSEDIKKHLRTLLDLPPRQKGTGTYQYYLSGIWGLCSLFPHDDDKLVLVDALERCGIFSDGEKYFPEKIVRDYDPNGGVGLGSYISAYEQLTGKKYPYKTKRSKSDDDEQPFELDNYIQWKKDEYQKFTEFTPTVTFNEQYVSDKLSQIDIEEKTTCIKSAMNTGKSYWLKSLKNKQLLILGNRRLLTQKLAGDLTINYIDDFFDLDLAHSLINGGQSSSIVVDSLTKLADLDFSEITLVVDEAEQVLESVLLASTHIKKVRGRVWAILAKIARECESIILMDANLSDNTCDYWHRISNKPLQKILNQYSEAKEKNRKAIVYEKKDTLYDRLNSALELKEKVLVVADSERELKALAEHFSDYLSVIISQPELGDNPDNRRFIEHQGITIKNEQIQLVLASPVIQSGISLEIGDYFDKVFGVFYGVLNTCDSRQMLMRNRGKCERHIWASPHGLGYANHFDWQEIKNSHQNNDQYLLECIKYFEEVKKLTRPEALKVVSQLIESQNELLNLNQEYIAKFKAKGNLNRSSFKDTLIQELLNDGYDCYFDEQWGNGLTKEIAEIKKSIRDDEALKIEAAEIIDENKAIELSHKVNLSEDERAKLFKHTILSMLPEYDLKAPFILEYILKNNFKAIRGIQNYFLVNNSQIAKTLDFNSVSRALSEANKGGVFYISSKRYSLLCDIWQSLSLQQLLGQTVATSECKAILDGVSARLRGILRGFGIKWNKQTYATKVIKSIVNLFGFTLKQSHQNQERFYQVEPIELIKDESNWQLIFNSIQAKLGKDLEINKDIYELITGEQFTNQPVQDMDAPTEVQNNIINNSSCVSNSTLDTINTPPPERTIDSENDENDKSIDWELVSKTINKFVGKRIDLVFDEISKIVNQVPEVTGQKIADLVFNCDDRGFILSRDVNNDY